MLLFNVLDRRGELAMMRAMGFSVVSIRNLLLKEHLCLFAAGVLTGGLAAVVAVLPNILDAGGRATATAVLLPSVIFAFGLLWIALAGRAALQRDWMESLRNE